MRKCGKLLPSLRGTVHQRAPFQTDVLMLAVVVITRRVLADAIFHDGLQNVERSALKARVITFHLQLLLC